MNAIATAALSENISAGFDLNDPMMILFAGGSLRAATLAALEHVVIVADEDQAPVSSAAPTFVDF